MNFFKILENFKNTELYEYRYITLEYLYGHFVFLYNDIDNNVFIKNDILNQSDFFKEKFKMNKYLFRIPNYIRLKSRYLRLIDLLRCDDVFYFNYIKDLSYYEFKQFIKLLNYLDLLKLDKRKSLMFYKNIISISYDRSSFNYDNIEIRYLLDCNF